MPLTQIDPKSALIAVDLQLGILRMAPEADAQRIVAQTKRLADAFHAAGLPVVWVQALGLPAGRTQMPKPGGAPSADFATLHPDLPLLEGDLHPSKKATSIFTNPEVKPFLEKHGITQVVVTGLATGMGVESTVRSAFDAGYNVVVARDAVTDGNAARGEHSLTLTLPGFAEIADTDDILSALENDR